MAKCRNWRKYCILLLIMATLVIAIQLLIITKFIYVPNPKTSVAPSDSVVITDISTLWCQEQEMSALYPFTTYVMDHYPSTEQDNVKTNHHFRMNRKLGWSDFLYFRAYLLPRSSIQVTTFSSEPGAYVYVVKGSHEFERCLTMTAKKVQRHHAASPKKDDDESSEDISSSNSEEDTEDPIKKAETLHKAAVVKNIMSVSSFFANCPHTFLERESIPTAVRSSNLIDLNIDNETSGNYTQNITNLANDEDIPVTGNFVVNVTSVGYYYIVVDNYYFGGINNIAANITLNRSHYDLKKARQICKNKETCTVPFDFASRTALVVEVPDAPSQNLVMSGFNGMFDISSTCKPRISFYFFLFLALPLLFGALSVFLYRVSMQKFQVQKHIIIPGTDTTETVWVDVETSKAPLLIGKGKFKWPSYTSIFSTAGRHKRGQQKHPNRTASNVGFTPLEVKFDSAPITANDSALPAYEDVIVFDRNFHEIVSNQAKKNGDTNNM